MEMLLLGLKQSGERICQCLVLYSDFPPVRICSFVAIQGFPKQVSESLSLWVRVLILKKCLSVETD